LAAVAADIVAVDNNENIHRKEEEGDTMDTENTWAAVAAAGTSWAWDRESPSWAAFAFAFAEVVAA